MKLNLIISQELYYLKKHVKLAKNILLLSVVDVYKISNQVRNSLHYKNIKLLYYRNIKNAIFTFYMLYILRKL